MNITTRYATIETSDSQDRAEIMVEQEISGFVAALELQRGYFVLATKEGSDKLILLMAPSARWEGDIRDAGYTIRQVLAPFPEATETT